MGRDRVARFFVGIARKFGACTPALHCGLISGLPGFVNRDHAGHMQTNSLAIEGGHIRAIYVTRNPDKLTHVRRRLGE